MSQVISKRQATLIVARNLKRIMDEKGVGIRQLGRDSENPTMTVSRLVNRHGLPSVDALKRMADALGVQVDEFFRDSR